ncbi:MAG: CmcI family methyltransferase, partial [Myxococcota bacterium]
AEDRRSAEALALPIARRKVEFLQGDCSDAETIAQVERRAAGKRVLVMLRRSPPNKAPLAGQLRAFASLISVGSYIIVQDTGSARILAIKQFLEDHPEFVVDRSRERLMLSSHVAGYLRRIDG